MKKKRVSMMVLAMLLALSLAMPVYGADCFSDLSGREDQPVIEKWCDYGVIKGYGGAFRPEDAITQVELDIMLDRLMGREISAWTKSAGLSEEQGWAMIKADFAGYTDKETVEGEMTRAEAVAALEKLVGPVEVIYSHQYISKLEGGFTDTLPAFAKAEGWTEAEFAKVCELPATSMSAIELKKMNNIRSKQLVPNEKTLVQKVVTQYDVNKYLDGSYKTPKGFISVCADVKQYKTIEDCYYGLRLDYSGTYFKAEDPTYGVIRFTAKNAAASTVPKSPANGGTVEDPYPFGGAGFTTGNNGRLGSPEWVMPGFAEIASGGAQILILDQQGKETVKGVYNSYAGRFLNLTIKVQ